MRLSDANLQGVRFDDANLQGAAADKDTRWPGRFDPQTAGVVWE